MKNKKIMTIITRLNVGGVSIHVVNLTHGMQKEYDTILVSGKIEKHESDMSYYAKKKNIDVLYLNKLSRELRFPADIIALWELFVLIKKEKPDIVDTHTAKAGTLGRLAAWLAGVPVIVHTYHGNIFKGYFSKNKTGFFILIEKMLGKITTKVIALSELQKNELLENKIVCDDKISVIKLGFDISQILPNTADFGTFKQKFQIPENSILISIIGRITAIKNHKLFIKIAEELLKQYDNLYFPIIGDGELREEIEQLILEKNLSNRVFITGFLEDLKSVYADVDYVLVTSINEGTPVTIIEAMAAGKVVIANGVGGIPDMIDNNVNGFYFNEATSDNFVGCLEHLIKDPTIYNNISINANKSACMEYHIDRMLKEMHLLYKEMLKEKNR